MKNPITMNFLLFIGFLVIGYSVSTRFYNPKYGALSNPFSVSLTKNVNSIPSLDNGQRTILLIGVNSLDPVKAELENLWLVTNLPPDTTLQFLPIIKTGKETNSDFEDRLYSSFKLDKKNGNLILSQDFIDLLKVNNYWWSGYFVIDHFAVEGMFNSLVKAAVNGEVISADHSDIEIPESINNPQNTYSIELTLLQTTCQRLSRISHTPDMFNMFFLDPKHLLTDLDRNEIVIEWNAFLSNGHSPNCNFPTLEIAQNDN